MNKIDTKSNHMTDISVNNHFLNAIFLIKLLSGSTLNAFLTKGVLKFSSIS